MRDEEIGPTRVETFQIGGKTLKLVRPIDPDRLLDHPEVHGRNRADDYMPYWAYLWPGAILLAEILSEMELKPHTSALEIGCGLGLGGLMGLLRGINVTFTDYDLDSLRFVKLSAAANGFPEADVRRLDWREPESMKYDLILGADVLYERRLVPLVADVLTKMLDTSGAALLTDPNRQAAEGLVEELRRRGFKTSVVPLASKDAEFGEIKGRLFQVEWA